MIKTHLSLVLIDGFFCNIITATEKKLKQTVTILILVDGFLQSYSTAFMNLSKRCHNPYFSRWFSAIALYGLYRINKDVTILILVDGFLQFRRNNN